MRKVLVISSVTQGERADDFNGAEDGSIAYVGSTCVRSHYYLNMTTGRCVCGITFVSASNQNTGTTAVVRLGRDVSDDDNGSVWRFILHALELGGWGDPSMCDVTAASFSWLTEFDAYELSRELPTLERLAKAIDSHVTMAIQHLPEGTIVERHNGIISPRPIRHGETLAENN